MIAKTYGIYDSILEEYVQTFTSKNDEEAKRMASQIVRTPNFDTVSYNDRSLHHLFDIDTATGKILNNNIYQVFIFATAIEKFKQDSLEAKVQEKIFTDQFKEELKELVVAQLKGELHKNEQNDN